MRKLLLSFLVPFLLFAQTDTLQNILFDISPDQFIEPGEFNHNQLEELLEDYSANPLNINSATFSELLSIPFMQPAFAESIIQYRKINGVYLSVAEIYIIKGIPYAYKKLLMRLLTTKNSIDAIRTDPPRFRLKQTFSTTNHQRIFKERSAKIITAANYSNSLTSFNLILEKDPKEALYADFYSFSVRFKNLLNKTDVYLGDYKIRFGLGLAHYNSSFNRNGDNIFSRIKTSSSFISESKSRDEFNFLRGIAIKHRMSNCLSITGFYSIRKLDAKYDSLDNGYRVYSDGYHLTQADLDNKNSFSETSYGIISQISAWNVELNILHKQLLYQSYVVTPVGNTKHSEVTSLFARYKRNRMEFSAEIATINNIFSTAGNIYIHLSPNIKFVSSIRSDNPDFYSLYSNQIKQFSSNYAELGFFNGLRIDLPKGKLNLRYEFFNVEHKQNPGFSENGKEFTTSYEYPYGRKFSFYSQFSYTEKPDFSSNNINKYFKRALKLDILYKPVSQISDKTRLNLMSFSQGNDHSTGWLFYNEIQLHTTQKFIFNFRLTFFDVQNYNSRIYVYEYDPSGLFYSNPYYGKGAGWYIAGRYKMLKNLDLSVKISSLTQEIESEKRDSRRFILHFQFSY